jgi:hypothetical protein
MHKMAQNFNFFIYFSLERTLTFDKLYFSNFLSVLTLFFLSFMAMLFPSDYVLKRQLMRP